MVIISYVVICRDDSFSGESGPYVLATRRVFDSHDVATEYASGISPSREAIVVSGHWSMLRFPE